jgi:hypothetical protein
LKQTPASTKKAATPRVPACAQGEKGTVFSKLICLHEITPFLRKVFFSPLFVKSVAEALMP